MPLNPDNVAQRLYDGFSDLTQGRSGMVLPTSMLSLSVCIIADTIEANDWQEEILDPIALGHTIAYLVECLRLLWPDAWHSSALDDVADEIAHHIESLLLPPE